MNELIKRLADEKGYKVHLIDGYYAVETKDWEEDTVVYSLLQERIRQAIRDSFNHDSWGSSTTDD